MPRPNPRDGRPVLDRSWGVRGVLAFFGLTFLLTTPIWAISAASGIQLLPGLPVAAVAVVCPAAAALFLTCRLGGLAAGRALLIRALDFRRIGPKAWWLVLVLLFPVVSLAAFLILRLGGSNIPNPEIGILSTAALFALFLVSALSEELGWTGFALNPLQARLGPLPAALLIGAVWAVWHYPALVQAHRSGNWIAWWTLGTVAMRVVIVWLYNRTGGSLFAAALLHAMSNLCWQLFPVHGSWFDPRLNGLILGGVVLAIVASFHPHGATRVSGLWGQGNGPRRPE